MKPLLVGEMPSRSGNPYRSFPLSGAVAQTLCQLAEIPPQEEGTRYGRWTWALYERFECVNAIYSHQPWDSAVAAARLREWVEPEHEVVVLLGRRPQSAYVRMTEPAESPVSSLDFFVWTVDPNSPTARREVCVIPHPSSLNRSYNAAFNRWRAGEMLRQAIDKAAVLAETRL